MVYSGTNVIDQIVPHSFEVSFASDDIGTRPGFTLLWQCFGELFDPLQSIAQTEDPLYTCCSAIEAAGFLKVAMNGFYMFTGDFVNGRHLYVEQNKVFGIWFDGDYGDWLIGWMSDLAEGNGYSWAYNNGDTSCPLLTDLWYEWWNNQWTFSKTAIVDCVV